VETVSLAYQPVPEGRSHVPAAACPDVVVRKLHDGGGGSVEHLRTVPFFPTPTPDLLPASAEHHQVDGRDVQCTDGGGWGSGGATAGETDG